MVKKVGLIGWNGKRNVGDDAMTSVMIAAVKQQFQNAEFKVLADEDALAIYTDEKNERMWIGGMRHLNRLSAVPKVGTYFNLKVFPKWFTSQPFDCLLIGGGSIIHRVRNTEKLDLIINRVKAKNDSVRIGAVCVSVGPFKSDIEKSKAQFLLEKLNFLIVRDLRSYNLLEEMGIQTDYHYAPDLALSLPTYRKVNYVTSVDNEKVVGVSLRIGYFTKKRKEYIISCIEYLIDEYGFNKVKIFNFCDLEGQRDHDCSIELIDYLKEKHIDTLLEIIDYSFNPVDFYQQIDTCDFMLCMRLHATIISYTMQTPLLIVPYHQKCIDFGKQVAKLNDDSFLHDKDEILEVKGKIDKIVANPNYQFEYWSQTIKESEQQLALMLDLLNMNQLQ